MKREILCESCHNTFPSKNYSGENIVKVKGYLKKNCFCDGCGKPMDKGVDAVAISIWTDKRNDYYKWEGEFIGGGK